MSKFIEVPDYNGKNVLINADSVTRVELIDDNLTIIYLVDGFKLSTTTHYAEISRRLVQQES